MIANKKLFAGYALGFLLNYFVGVFWISINAGHVSGLNALSFLSILFISVLAGDLFQEYGLLDRDRFNGLLPRLVFGALITITSLYILALVLPFGLPIDWGILSAIIILLHLRHAKSRIAKIAAVAKTPEIILLSLVPLLVTVWCRDLLPSVTSDGTMTTIHTWPDVFYHISEIASLASSHGFHSLSDVQMAGAHPQPYHMASYIFPALLVATTQMSSLTAYCGSLVPFGIMLAVYSCYSLTSSVFGAWPGCAASLALLCLPDAFQQHFGNQFLSYHWLLQIAPASAYGLASAAMSFLLVFESCRSRQWKLFLLGYSFGLMTLLFKAQLFVAISLLVFIFPALFMAGIPLRLRVFWTALLAGFYFVILYVAQSSPNIPNMRLDGSALDPYSSVIFRSQTDGKIKTLFSYLLAHAHQIWLLKAAILSILLCIVTFGVFPLIYLVILRILKKSISLAELLFPILVVAVYLLMATGLSYDDRHFGGVEELLHRPFVWAYFVICAWSVGGIYRVVYDDAPPAFFGKKYLLPVIIPVLFIVPIMFGPGIQTFPQWSMEFVKLPNCQLKVAQFIKDNSQVYDVIQDSMNDSNLVFSGLSMRQNFAIDSGGTRQPPGVKDRLLSLAALKGMSDIHRVEEFMTANKIKFYIQNKDNSLKWDDALSSHMKMKCNDYKVYGF